MGGVGVGVGLGQANSTTAEPPEAKTKWGRSSDAKGSEGYEGSEESVQSKMADTLHEENGHGEEAVVMHGTIGRNRDGKPCKWCARRPSGLCKRHSQVQGDIDELTDKVGAVSLDSKP